jgi:hypothetical protein
MKRLLVVCCLAAVSYLAIPLIAGAQSGMAVMTKGENGMPEYVGSTGGKVHVSNYSTAPDGGTVRQSADEHGRAYVRPVSADGGIPEVSLGTANPLPVVPTDALHPPELTVSTTCLFLTLPSASALTPTAGQRYRLMARNDYVCVKSGSAPVSCEGVPMFAPDAPESVAFAAGDLYFFTPGAAAAIELCPLVEQ